MAKDVSQWEYGLEIHGFPTVSHYAEVYDLTLS